MATAVQLHGHPLPPHVSLLPLSFQVNRQRISVSPHDTTVAWDSTLLEYLRDHVRLTGTKLGCGEGGCGACTVVVLRPKSRAQLQREQEHDLGNGLPYDIRAVNSCLMPLIAVHGCQVITIEGIGTERHPHAIQQRLAFLFGSQCGFCTPGIIMSFYATLRNAGKRGLSERDIERGMDGNLCRCTGYRPILDALKTFAKASETADDDEYFNGLEAVTANSQQQQQQLSCSSPAGACPRGEDCCRFKRKDASASGGKTPPASVESGSDTSSSRTSVSSGHDSGFASSNTPLPASSLSLARARIASKEPDGLMEYDGANEPIFPAWLLRSRDRAEGGNRSVWDDQDLGFVDVSSSQPWGLNNGEEEEVAPEDSLRQQHESRKSVVWLRPSTLSSLVTMLRFYNSRQIAAKLRSGDSECRIEVKSGHREYSVSIYTGNIPSLCRFESTDEQLSIGSLLPINDITAALKSLSRKFSGSLHRSAAVQFSLQVFRAIMSNISHFASTQIRNVACVGGNVATASPISDLNPVWLALNSEVRYIDALELSEDDVLGEDDAFLERLEGRISMSNFFRGYRKTALPAGAVITRIVVSLPPPPDPNDAQETRRFTRAYKQAKRVDDDIATVTCCLYLEVEAVPPDLGQSWTVREARFAYGGMAPTTVLAKETAEEVRGSNFNDDTLLDRALDRLGSRDFDLALSVPGGMASYRKALALSFFAKFWSEVTEELQSEVKVRSSLPSAFKGLSGSALVRPVTRGSQDFEQVQVKVKGGSGESMPHLSALKQCAGTAEYVDDIALQEGELVGALVLTTTANAKIVSIDATPALMPNGPALWFVEENDLVKLGGRNAFLFDDRFFAGSRSDAVGMVIGVVLAKTKRLAQAAARMVKVEYERLGPPVLDIDSAISAESFLPPRPKIQTATNEEFDDWSDCEHVLEGTTRLGGQSHFYLETNACLIVPSKEGDDMEVWSSTQNPSETQAFVSEALCIPMSRINVRVKRIGGGFGGKETRSVILAAVMAVASKVSGRPVRCQLDRDEDMLFNGQRHPFKGEWRIGMTRTGKFKKFDVKVYNNAGHSQDLSRAVLERAMFHIDGCYRWPALRVRGWMCRTHTVSNTAFRGFGGPQGIFIVEDALTKAARSLGLLPEDVRALNFNIEGDLTHYKQPLVDWNVPTMWQELKRSSDFDRRRRAIDIFNKENRWKKRGITLQATRFGLSYTFLTLNQARCLVHIYAHDGSVMISHAGVEMGQGLHSKVSQVAASELGVDNDTIHISQTSTRETANTSATAASVGSDLNGAAVKDACEQLKERLKPYRKPGISFREAAHQAYMDRVNLSAVGHYKTPIKGMDWEKGEGEPFFYWTQGVVCTEAEIDVATGDNRVVRADICMDIARSINPGIDVGQIEGAFTQGLGLVTIEESLWKPNGDLVTKGPGNYKIPAFLDTPSDMRISFMKASHGRKMHHLRTVQGSKGVGEPPLTLGCFHFFAIKDAVRSARIDHGLLKADFDMDAPATPERIRLACGDLLAQQAMVKPKVENERDFFVRIS